MKIAICFSGEPRFVNECFPLIKKNIIDVNDNIDFFIHTWFSDDIVDKKLYTNSISSFGESTIKKDVIEDINRLYNPKSIMLKPLLNSTVMLIGDLVWIDIFLDTKNLVIQKLILEI